MSRLDQIDLSKSLSRSEEQRGLENAWARLAQLRLTLGGQIGPKRIGPAVLVLLIMALAPAFRVVDKARARDIAAL